MTTATYMIGVVQMPSLAAALTAAGYTVVTDDEYRHNATKIRSALDEHGAFPVFVADRRNIGIKAWTGKTAEITDVFVLRVADGANIAFVGTTDVAVPATLGELMARAQRGVHPTFAALEVDLNGEVAGYETGAYAPAPVADFDIPTPVVPDVDVVDVLAPQADPLDEPVAVLPAEEPTAAHTAPVAPVVEDDPWGDAPVAVVDTVPVAPAVEDDPWDDAPAAAESVSFEAPAEPAATPAPVAEQDDPWGDEHVAEQVAEEPVAEPTFSFTAPTVEVPVAESVEVPAFSFTAPPADEPVVPVVEDAEDDVTFDSVVPPSVPVAAPVAPVVTAPVAEPTQRDHSLFEHSQGRLVQHSSGVPVSLAEPVRTFTPTGAPAALGTSTGSRARTFLDGPGGKVAFVWAAKGGVGKTSSAASVAQAAAQAGLNVLLIDGNYGQGDLRLYLRLGMVSLPSINNFAHTGELSSCVVDPETLKDVRDLRAERLLFGLILTPPEAMVDRSLVDHNVYADLIEKARREVDLVVVDTQIIEAPDKNKVVERYNEDMVEKLIIPMLAAGAYGVAVTDLSNAGVSNQLSRLKYMSAQGVPRERQLLFINRVPVDLAFRHEALEAVGSEHATYLGICYNDTRVQEHQNTGGIPGSVGELGAKINRVLTQIYPDLVPPELRQAPERAASDEPTGRRRRGLFGRR